MLSSKSLKYNISNEKIRELTGVGKIEEVLPEMRLQWLEHVERVNKKRVPRKALYFKVDS